MRIKMTLKKLKRGDVVSIDDCQFYGSCFVRYAFEKVRAFHGSDEAGSDLEIR